MHHRLRGYEDVELMRPPPDSYQWRSVEKEAEYLASPGGCWSRLFPNTLFHSIPEQIAGYDLEKGHGCCQIIFDSPFMAIFPYHLMAADGTE